MESDTNLSIMSLEGIQRHTADENELKKRELTRLLQTATDEDRKLMLSRALQKMEELPSSNNENGGTIGNSKDDDLPSTDSRKSNLHRQYSQQSISPALSNELTSPLAKISSGSMNRPVSASPMRRRPSFLLDTIPENKEISLMTADHQFEQCIHSGDLLTAVSSCADYNRDCQLQNLFNNIPILTAGLGIAHLNGHFGNASPKNSRLQEPKWVSTGLMPQFFFLRFREKWLVKRVEIECTGLRSILVSVSSYKERGDRDHHSSWDYTGSNQRRTLDGIPTSDIAEFSHRRLSINSSAPRSPPEKRPVPTTEPVRMQSVRDGMFVYRMKTVTQMLAHTLAGIEEVPSSVGACSDDSPPAAARLEGNMMTITMSESTCSFCVIRSIRIYGAPHRDGAPHNIGISSPTRFF